MEKIYYEKRIKQALAMISFGLALLIVYVLLGQHTAEESNRSSPRIISFDPLSVTEIRISADKETELVFVDDSWICISEEIAVDQNKVAELCELVSETVAVRVLENAGDYSADFGLEEPLYRVFMKHGGGEFTLRTGIYNKGTRAYYMICESDPDTVYLVRDKYVTPFLLGRADLVPGLESCFPAKDSIFEIQVSSEKAKYCLLKTEYLPEPLYSTAYKWAISGVYPQAAPAYDNRISAFISGLESIKDSDRVCWQPSEEQLAKMDFASGAIVKLKYREETKEKVFILHFSPPDEEGNVFVSDDEFKLIYKMAAADYVPLSRYFSNTYLMAKNLCKLDFEHIKQIKVTGNSIKLNLRADLDSAAYYVGTEQIDTEKAEKLISALEALSCEGYMPYNSLIMPEHIADTLSFVFEDTEGYSTELCLRMYDSNFYVATIGAVDTALISKTSVTSLKELASSILENN